MQLHTCIAAHEQRSYGAPFNLPPMQNFCQSAMTYAKHLNTVTADNSDLVEEAQQLITRVSMMRAKEIGARPSTKMTMLGPRSDKSETISLDGMDEKDEEGMAGEEGEEEKG
jgi:hypothetical protein